jgi:hypothetical protein
MGIHKPETVIPVDFLYVHYKGRILSLIYVNTSNQQKISKVLGIDKYPVK